MKSLKKTSKIIGILFLVAMVASILGGSMVEEIISSSDSFNAVSEVKAQLIIGVLLELINGISVIGIAVLMFLILKKQNENMAFSYLSIRVIEAILCIVAVITPLAFIYLKKIPMDAQTFNATVPLLIAIRAGITELLIPLFFCLGALLFYTLLYRTMLLPRFISVWGIIATILILIMNFSVLVMTKEINMALQMTLALPIIINEIFLGIWLIVKGFNFKNTLKETKK